MDIKPKMHKGDAASGLALCALQVEETVAATPSKTFGLKWTPSGTFGHERL
jgi:hypothetical protein